MSVVFQQAAPRGRALLALRGRGNPMPTQDVTEGGFADVKAHLLPLALRLAPTPAVLACESNHQSLEFSIRFRTTAPVAG